jgi:hypothetical protein
MKKRITVLLTVVFILSFVSVVSAASLTGTWSCNDGGTYYIRQLGNEVYWYGEKDPNHPEWSNVAKGRREGNKIYLEWADVPKGHIMSSGILTLKIVPFGQNKLVRINVSGGFGGSEWTRE